MTKISQREQELKWKKEENYDSEQTDYSRNESYASCIRFDL